MKPSCLLSILIIFVKKRLRQRRFYSFIKIFFIIVPFAEQNTFVFRDSPLEVVGNVRFVRIQSIRVVNLLIVDVHFNVGKDCVRNFVYMGNETNWYLLHRRFFFIRFCLSFVLLLYYSAIVSFVTTTPVKFQFQSKYV